MKLIIDIPKCEYDKICKTMLHTSSGNPNFYFESKIAHGTPIPDNATNGDVIKALYSDAKYDTYFDFIAMTTHTERTVFMSRFDRDWWNAPYQKGGKE